MKNSNLIWHLRNPPFGTGKSHSELMRKAADVIESNNCKELIALVIAGREAFDTFMLPDEEQRNLDAALEKFSCLVPYDKE